jgi:hypothetical protein
MVDRPFFSGMANVGKMGISDWNQLLVIMYLDKKGDALHFH